MMNLAQLQKLLENQLVRGNYKIIVGKFNPREQVIYRSGVARDEFKGRVKSVFRSKEGNVCVVLRHFHRITPGDRKSVSDELLKIAEESPRAYKGLPGEFKFRSLRLEGILDIKIMKAGKWVPVMADFKEWDREIKKTPMLVLPRAPRKRRMTFEEWERYVAFVEVVKSLPALERAHNKLRR